jgi:NAD(P)-dependent dehydrogenase (short-subunit alcohol dehydrogenase family)
VTALVTGASKGLGLGLCIALAKKGSRVFAACRHTTPELAAAKVEVIEGIDVATAESMPRLRAGVGDARLELLICNAGINITFDNDGISSIDLDELAYEYQVNAVGALRSVRAVLPNMAAGSKIALITTGPMTLGRTPPGPGHYGYRMSKAALNTLGYLLSVDLRSRGISVRIISPGPVQLDILRAVFAAGRTAKGPEVAPDPVAAAERVLAQIDDLTPESSGSWVDQNGKAWA